MRGEDHCVSISDGAGIETPPRAWRRFLKALQRIKFNGNTSTCVEKIKGRDTMQFRLEETPPRAWRRLWHSLTMTCSIRKHLHVRGEDLAGQVDAVNDIETPPRAWRRLRMIPLNSAKNGNTSTCVEKIFSYL